MARSAVNKSQLIRDALKAHRSKTPSQIAEVLKDQGVHVTGTYVSNVKFNSRNKRRRTHTVTSATRRTRGPRRAGAGSLANIPAALRFINDVGGLKAAKATVAMLEKIGNSVR